jgi:hypothetical protein
MKNNMVSQVMRMIKFRIPWLTLLAISALLLASGCDRTIRLTDEPTTVTVKSPQKPSSVITDQSGGQTESQFTSTPMHTNPTPLPSMVSTETILTPTLVPEPIETHILTLMPTRLPTLPVNEAEDLVMELYASNGGCQLHCWWGIVPGQTPGIVAKRFLETFAIYLAESGSTKETTMYYEVALPAPREVYETYFQL